MILTRAERFESRIQEDRYAHIKELGELIANSAADPLDRIVAAEEAALLWGRAKNTLSPLEMAVLKYYVAGYSTQEIARDLERSAKAVDNALTRVKSKFRTKIAKAGTPDNFRSNFAISRKTL